MKRKKLNSLLSSLEKEMVLAKKRAKEARLAANETSKTSRTSWSAAGERDYSQGQADVLSDYYEKVKSVREKVEVAVDMSVPKSIDAPSFIKLYLNGEEKEFYLLTEPINLEKFNLITSNSPLGEAILGKEAGEKFEFATGNTFVKGVVLSVE